MRKLVAALMSAGLVAGAGMATTTSAEAHHWRDRGCCTYLKRVVVRVPVDKIEKRVETTRVFSWKRVETKRLYRDRCTGRRFYRVRSWSEPVLKEVPRVYHVRVRAYREQIVTKRYTRRCCGRDWF
jgi:hypothetical protein